MAWHSHHCLGRPVAKTPLAPLALSIQFLSPTTRQTEHRFGQLFVQPTSFCQLKLSILALLENPAQVIINGTPTQAPVGAVTVPAFGTPVHGRGGVQV